jgi:hypothetical protein
LPKGAAGAAKQAALVEASLSRKKKKAEKAKRRQEKEMEIARRVRMGEDRDVVQEEYESEPSTNSDDEDCSEEEESESGDADLFVVNTHRIEGSEIPEGSRMSASAPEARKHVAEDDTSPREEAKRARVEEHPGHRRCRLPWSGAKMSWGSAPVRKHARR